MRKYKITESRLRNMVRKSVRTVLRESMNEGTPKQNAFLRKLMGDRYKDEYDDLSVADTSKMIDSELAGRPQKEYEVVDTIGGEPDIYPCKSFYEAKKKLGEIVNEYYDEGHWSCYGDVWLRKESDICYVAGGRSLGVVGRIYIRKKK